MVNTGHILDGVAEGAMTDIVKGGGAECFESVVIGDIEPREDSPGDVDDADAVLKSAVFGTVIDEVRESKLSNSAQALKRLCADEVEEDPLDVVCNVEGDDVVNRISEELGFHRLLYA